MCLPITNCVVSQGGNNVLTNPASATLTDDMKPTVTITITGGNIVQAPVVGASYKITGQVGGTNRTFLNMVCKSNTSPYKFTK